MSNYTPPASDAVNFALKAYTPPAYNAVNFELGNTTDYLFNIFHTSNFTRAANIRVRKNGQWVLSNKIKTYINGAWQETALV